ncbi:MAG: tetratricopeptide repeat protein [Desulfatibacillaceae bacterium]
MALGKKDKDTKKEKAPRVRARGEIGEKTSWDEENKKLIGLMQAGNLDEALDQAHKLLDHVDAKYGKKDHPEKATTYNNMGMVLMMKGMWDLADEAFRDALEMRKKIYGREHREVAVIYLNMTQLYKLQAQQILAELNVEVQERA